MRNAKAGSTSREMRWKNCSNTTPASSRKVETSRLTPNTIAAIAAIAARKTTSYIGWPMPLPGSRKVSAPIAPTGSSHRKMRPMWRLSRSRSAVTMPRIASRRHQAPARNASTGSTKPASAAPSRTGRKFASMKKMKMQA